MTDPHYEKQLQEWENKYHFLSSPPPTTLDIDPEKLKDDIIEDLNNVNNMPVEEYTLYQKWWEIKTKYPTKTVKTIWGKKDFFVYPEQKKLIHHIKDNLWYPETPSDYLNLEPELIYSKDNDLAETWNCVRTFTSTMKNNSNIGRNLNYIVIDRPTGKYLGVICISSDFLDLTPRDKYIGWDRKKKTQGHMINFTAIGSTIVPTQPLGYNYMGGKLLALLCLSDEVQYQWKKQYGDVLAGITTTSLYGKNKQGGLSQYDRLNHWIKMGYSSGSVSYEATKPTVERMIEWLKYNHPHKYFDWYVAKKPSGQPYKRDHKNRSYNFIYSKLGIPKNLIRSEHQRGIYFAPLYDNTKEFLCGDISESDLKKSFKTDYHTLTETWKNKYASKRIDNLIKENRVSSSSLFYDDLVFKTWDDTKVSYLSQVGR